MEPNRSSQQGSNLSTEDVVEKGDRGVHVIYVPTATILQEMHLGALAPGAVGTATLSQVAKHIGAPAPTDIIVFAGEPWHYAGPPGHLELRPHPQVHVNYPETVLELKKGTRAVWWSLTPFNITAIGPSPHPNPNPRYLEAPVPPPVPKDPFVGPLTYGSKVVHGTTVFTITSTVAKTDASGHLYKITFEVDHQKIDPDMYCAP